MTRLLVTLLALVSLPALAARSVSVQWEKISGASKYEIEINGDKTSIKETVPSTATEWKGELPPGQYAYRIRAIDAKRKAGKWTSFQSFTIRGNDYHVAAGVDGGFNYFFPGVHLQRTITPRIALGIHPTFSSSYQLYTQIHTVGFFVTGSYFLTEEGYNGFSAQLGLGAYWIHEPYFNETAFPAAFSAAVRWRRELKYGIDFSLLAGGQVIAAPGKTPDRWVVKFQGVLPYFAADVGINF